MILTIRTDKDTAKLALYDRGQLKKQFSWTAGRQLSTQLLPQILQLLEEFKLKLPDLKGIVVFRGPGSFTGLRIGIAVANTLAYGMKIPIVGSTGKDWHRQGLKELMKRADHKVVLPIYGAEPHITRPKQ